MPPTTSPQLTPNLDHEALLRATPRILIGLLCGAFIVLLGVAFLRERPVVETPDAGRIDASAFARLQLEAAAVLVWDAPESAVIFGRDARRSMPLASVSKIMTALVAHEVLDENRVILISASALATEGGNGLSLGERWTRDGLIAYMLVTSSNDAATALAESYAAEHGTTTSAFIVRMNEKARELGLTDTTFVNPSGLDEASGMPVNRGTAYDVARLFAHAIGEIPHLLDATRFERDSIASLDAVHTVNNTNPTVSGIPWAIGSKTGFTDSAGGNLALSFDIAIGHPIVVVVLGSSREGRFADVERLIAATRAHFESESASGTVEE